MVTTKAGCATGVVVVIVSNHVIVDAGLAKSGQNLIELYCATNHREEAHL